MKLMVDMWLRLEEGEPSKMWLLTVGTLWSKKKVNNSTSFDWFLQDIYDS